jgi:hypothetical protein
MEKILSQNDLNPYDRARSEHLHRCPKTEAAIGYQILRDIDLHPGITTMSGHLPGNVACPLGIAGRRALPCGTTFAIDNKNEARRQVPDMHSPRPRRHRTVRQPSSTPMPGERQGYRAGVRR